MAAPVQINANLNLNPASINASAKQVQQALGRITNQASEFQKSLDASTARVFAFGATTSIINGITQSFKSLLSTTVSVQAKLTEINTILGAGASEFNKYRNSIFKVAKETGQTFETVADGAAELARQGLGAVESAKRLKAALVLTRISGLGAEQSVKALTAAMNGFTSAGLSANQIVNKIVAVDTAFAVSAQDLAEGFSRAGSTAEDAGVSFEQLLGLITAVEQRTSRGGAVIGNAFKSIFTRISRSDTVDQLKELGVQINANQNGVQKLQALSNALDTISDPGKISKIKELAGGVFQINVVSAALKDLGSEASIFAQATETGLKASNEATQKNTELNKTLLAQINSLTASITSFAEKLGGITFGPLLQNLLGIAEKLSSGLDAALDPEKGNKFIQGLFKVIGGFLSGPGLALFTVAFFKIFRTVIKFAKDGFKTIMEMGSATERVKQIEGGIVGLLQKDVTLRKILESSSASQATKEKAVIDAIKRQNALLTQQQQIVSNIAAVAMKSGVRGFDSSTGSFQGKKGKRYAAGGSGQMEPDLMTAMINEARDAPAGAVPYVTNFRGSPAVMNTSEMQVRIGGREEILTAEQIPRFNKGTIKKGGDQFVLLTPKIGQVGEFGPMTVDKKKHPYIHPIKGPDPNSIKGISDGEEADIEKKIKQSIFKEASEWTKNIKPLDKTASVSSVEKGFNQIAGAKGALKSAIGAAFEVGISKSLGYEALESDGGDFDIYGGKNLNKIQELFKIKQSVGDFKVSDSIGNRQSFVRKVRKEVVASKPQSERQRDKSLNEKAKQKAIQRDRRLNPQFYTEKGELKMKGEGGGILGQSERIKRSMGAYKGRLLRSSPQLNFSKGTISNSQLKARTKTPRFSRGSAPGLKVGRFSRGSIGKAYRSPMRRYASGTTPLVPTAFNASGSKEVMKFQAFKDAIKSINEMNSEAKKAAKSIGDKVQREKLLTQAAKDHQKNLTNLAKQYNLTTKAVKKNATAQKLMSGGKGMFGKFKGGGLGAGFGLSMAGDLIGSLGRDEEGKRTEGPLGLGAVARVGGKAASYAATGAMFGGPIGAAVGGLIGLSVGLFGESEADKAEEEARKEEQRLANQRKSRFEGIKKQEANILGDFGGTQKSAVGLKNLAFAAGDSGLDISESLMNAKKQLDAAAITGEGFAEAQEKYNKIANKASKLLGNKDGIIALYEEGKKIKSELERIKKENAGAELSGKLDILQRRQGAASTLLGAIGGPNAKFMEQTMAVDNQFLAAGQVRAKQMDLEAQLRAEEDPEKRKALREALVNAGKEFKEKVFQGALFMKKTQIENAKRIEALDKKRADAVKNRRTSMIDEISSAAEGKVVDVDYVRSFREDFKGAETDEELGGLISGLKAYIEKVTSNPETKRVLMRIAGVGDDAKNTIVTDAKLKDLTKARFPNAKGDDLQDLMGTLGSSAFDKTIDQIDEEAKLLKQANEEIRKKMEKFAEDFNAGGIQEQLNNLATNLQKTATAIQYLPREANKVVGVASQVSTFISTAETSLEIQTKRIEDLTGRLSDLEGEKRSLTSTER